MAKTGSKTMHSKEKNRSATTGSPMAAESDRSSEPKQVRRHPVGEGAWVRVGMDVHKEHCQLCIETELGVLVEVRLQTRRSVLEAHCGGRPRLTVLMEASTESEWVAQTLESLGHQVVVADPNFAPMYATRNRKIKTDRRDAHALLDALRVGTYRPAHRRTEQMRDTRVQLLLRDHLVRSRTKSINVCRTVLRQYGVRVTAGEAETFVQRCAPQVTVEAVGQVIKQGVDRVLERVEELTRQIEQMDQELGAQVQGQQRVQNLMTVPGVGPVVSLGFCSLVDQAQRFDNAKQVGSYLGLVPGEHSSGESQRRTGITKAGDGLVRRLLVQAAHSLMRSTKPEAARLRNWALRIKEKSGRAQVAAVALARKLAGILWAMMRDGTRFGPKASGPALSAAAPEQPRPQVSPL